MRKFASAILVMIIGSSLGIAQTKTYEVKSGDTFDEIASRFHVSHADLVRANPISNSHKLKLGQKLHIPKPSAVSTGSNKKASLNAHQYRVRNGDQDWAIAAKYDIKPSALRQMNPNVNWNRLQIGQVIQVPGSSQQTAIPSKSSPAQTTVASHKTSGWGFPTTAYAVRSGDNDWTIAHRFSIGLKKLRMLNPGVDLTHMKPGQYVRVPGTQGAVRAASNVIRSRYAVIIKDSVLVRRGASTDSEKIVVVDKGTAVSVLDRQNGWYKLQFPRGTVGWVRGDMLKALNSNPNPETRMAANTERRTAPSRDSIRSVPTSRVATHKSVTTKTVPTQRVAYNRGAAKQVASIRRSPRSGGSGGYRDNGEGNSDIVGNALNMLGTRYVYGAASRSATDCSGMVMQAAGKAGVRLPRTSLEMSHTGKAVSRGELKPGDLVFFNTRGSRVSHVGIYKGNGQFVHASSGKGYVTVSNLSDGYYSRRYVGARRVAGSTKKRSTTVAKSSSKPTDSETTEKSVDTKSEAPTEKKTTRNTDEINP